MTAAYYNIAEVFAKMKDFDTALQYMDECIKIDQELNLSTLEDDLKYRESLKEKYDHHKNQTEVKAEVKKEKTGWLWGKKKSNEN